MRPLLLLFGLAVLMAAWFLPAPAATWPFSDHMVRHMSVVTIGALAVVCALPAGVRAPPAMVAAVVEFVAVWGWHLPAAHSLAQTDPLVWLAEQACFLGAGLLVWRTALVPGRELAGALALLLTSMHMTLLGTILILAPRILYDDGICGGLADQQLGGMIMLEIGTPVYLAGGVALIARLLHTHEVEP